MIDIHCHILPDFDDGPAYLEESLEMARIATYSGVTDIIATPHLQGRHTVTEQWQGIVQRYKLLTAALRQAQIPLRLYPGAEIRCLTETPDLAQRRLLPTLVGTDYVLLEFYFDEPFSYMDSSLEQIQACGYRPVVAHPERYNAIQQDPQLLQRWSRRDYVLQVNKGSLLGDFGPQPEQAANEILAMGLADLLASDAHDCYQRTPHMATLRQWVETYCDPEYAQILLDENPRRLLLNQPMVGAE